MINGNNNSAFGVCSTQTLIEYTNSITKNNTIFLTKICKNWGKYKNIKTIGLKLETRFAHLFAHETAGQIRLIHIYFLNSLLVKLK